MPASFNRNIGYSFNILMRHGLYSKYSDAALIEKLCLKDDSSESAFAELVNRHGPMVRRVCRAILQDEHETQDAFQATFLILAMKANTLWIKDSIGPWLHGVAYRTARCARRQALRRRAIEMRSARSAAVQSGDTSYEPEIVLELHAELARLPDKFRIPIILCHLHGFSHEQAAEHLGWPVGTVRSRLARGRDRLRSRLERRGLAPSAMLLSGSTCIDAIGRRLIANTTRLSLSEAGEVPASIASLVKGALRDMAFTKKVAVAVAVVATGLLVTGVGAMPQSTPSVGKASERLDRGKSLSSLDLTLEELPIDSLVIQPLPEGKVGFIVKSPNQQARRYLVESLPDQQLRVSVEGVGPLGDKYRRQYNYKEIIFRSKPAENQENHPNVKDHEDSGSGASQQSRLDDMERKLDRILETLEGTRQPQDR